MSNIFTPRGGNPNRPQIPGGLGGLMSIPVAIAAFVGIVIWMSYTPIDEGEVGVKLRWGQAVATLEPGFNIVIPFMESVVILPTREQTYTFENPLNSYSKDIQAANNKVSVTYNIDRRKAIEVYSRYGQNFLETIIKPIVNKRFKEVFGRYEAEKIVNERQKLGEEIQESVRSNMPSGILVGGVQIENIEFSEKIRRGARTSRRSRSSREQGAPTARPEKGRRRTRRRSSDRRRDRPHHRSQSRRRRHPPEG